jgi:hypothetical protein
MLSLVLPAKVRMGTERIKPDQLNLPRFLRIEVIEGVTIEEIKRVTMQCVKPGSKIVSDGHSSYKPLAHNG